MITYTTFDLQTSVSRSSFAPLQNTVAAFLETHLDAYGDTRADILRCLAYALDPAEGKGGTVITATDTKNENKIIGAVVLNNTGMQGYIPESILVYIAVHADYRGQGLGKTLMQHAINAAPGSIALHVEPDNPAKALYEKLGFRNDYLEMRLHR